MKVLGILGGLGPESTIEYYRQILSSCRKHTGDGSAPAIIINSIDVEKVLRMVAANQKNELSDYLVKELMRLIRAGTEVGLIAANTPHIVFDEIQSRVALPLVSIAQATCDEAKSLGLERLALFGTRFTMEAGFYQSLFTKEGMEIVLPSTPHREYIHEKYVNELLRNAFLPATRDGLLAIVERLIEQKCIDGLILGGTELPLILKESSYHGIPVLDTTRLHVKSAVAQMLSD